MSDRGHVPDDGDTDDSDDSDDDAHTRQAGSPSLVVEGIAVEPPLTEAQALRLIPLGLLADDPAGLRTAWARVTAMWDATVDGARRLPTAALDERVDGEWSFLETIRHLVFVIDVWIGEILQGRPSPFHALGLPPHFVTNGAELGLDIDARPSMDDVLACRAERMAYVADVIAHSTADDLARPGAGRDGRFSALGAFQVVVFEEWAHHQYATRDLAVVASR